MTGRRSRSNLLTRGLARLVAGVSREVIDTALELATGVRSRYVKDQPAQVQRAPEWWNTNDTGTKRQS